MDPATDRTLIVMPTYKERDSLALTVGSLRAVIPAVDILIVDDNSPDGTGDIADGLAADSDKVHVLHRRAKNGLGAAYIAGFGWGIDHGYDVMVEMDADGSHRAEDLPALLAGIRSGADLVIGSRWVPGGSILNWPRHRAWLSKAGNSYVRTVLGIGLRDATAGFRAYRSAAIDKLNMQTIASQGYCFQVDMAWRARKAGLDIREVPITFVEREHGASKMNSAIVIEALWRTTLWGVMYRAQQLRKLLGSKTL
ncbi:polyprenol monophosphomannose synthase [Saxibacter everestensis]|uniref:Polyprenol monophosphomannose synthase n=1 Tax=Saxibacter everestensis TaxID=2909229 RepID=A0ABY8QZ23_9MICO|nr:polyprenol monophosphomannose synthase [Brevibacteriaceae bacterium ZFBP1038]